MRTLANYLKQVPLAAAANAAVKARLIERDAQRTRSRYARDARRRSLVVPTFDELERALAHRIGARRSVLGWPRQTGDLHIFLAYRLTNWEAVLPHALAAFGQVTTFEWRSLGFDDMATDWLARRAQMSAAMWAAFEAATRVRRVDLVVTYGSGNTLSPEVLLRMAAHGAVITNFCFDDKVRWPGPKRGGRYASTAAIAHAVDLNLTSDPNGLVRYAAHGGLALFHPEAADPELHQPLQTPFEYDVSFIGARYGARPAFVEALRRHGITVECFGNGWPNGPLANEEMKWIYAKSRINLGFGGVGYSRHLVCLKGRDFEVPMSGALYLTQHNPELDLVFDVGREMLTYRDAANCARLIHELLRDEQRAAGVRRAGRERCLREHTYTARWGHVLRTLGALGADQPEPSGQGSSSSPPGTARR